MFNFIPAKIAALGLSLLAITTSVPAMADGIVLAGTRIIYPAESKQVMQSIRNTSSKSSYLVQTWIESSDGKKTSDFIVTPPLYVSNPKDENTLRVMYTGKPLPKDRESLYFFNAKSVPSVDKKSIEGKNVLLLAAVTRVKLFVRPEGLKPASKDAPSLLGFSRSQDRMLIKNPTPYYITLVNIKSGNTALKDTMVAPMSEASVTLPRGSGSLITYNTINDHGAISPQKTAVFQ
ncbi:fimbria/pilus periplasmic chaperone [Enterobacter asburiae]|uniref:fimbria/pilus periplasmic chaperone n=1 Tax=Enterobacter asburiae TaxID=61645 RepID=UPI0032AF1135